MEIIKNYDLIIITYPSDLIIIVCKKDAIQTLKFLYILLSKIDCPWLAGKSVF